MEFDNELINLVLQNADIVKIISSYLDVQKKGRGYWAVCPFHDDTKPSLSISPEKKIFKCFACGTSGNAITFVQKYEHIPFMEAMRKVAEMSGFDDPRLHKNIKPKVVDSKKDTLLKCIKDLTDYYQYALNTQEGQEGLTYLSSRNLNEKIRDKFLLGYAFKNGANTIKYLQNKGHTIQTIEQIGILTFVNGQPNDINRGRVIFPLFDSEGHPVGYSARRLKDSDEAKYVNSPDTYLFKKSSILYNYHNAKNKAQQAKYVYVLEGFMDVYALERIGEESAVALMGTAFTDEHIALLRKLNVEIRLCLDGDLAGQKAMMDIAKKLIKAGLTFRIVDNQNSPKDPDEILNQDGEGALRTYLNKLINHIDFALNYYQNTNPLQNIEQKKALLKEFIPILVNIKDALELDFYVRRLSSVTSFSIEAINNLIKDAKKNQKQVVKENNNYEEVINNFHPEKKVLRRLELAERELLYQMINNDAAIYFYEEKSDGFYNEIYRAIANYLVDYAKEKRNINVYELISNIEMSDIDNKQQLIDELTNLSLEKTHPNICSPELLSNLLESISEEKEKIFEKDTLDLSLQGKSDLEKARIIAEYNRRKMKKLNK